MFESMKTCPPSQKGAFAFTKAVAHRIPSGPPLQIPKKGLGLAQPL